MADVNKITGEFTGAYAVHPLTGKEIPIWIGDYVLSGYGTGAVMAVPAGDERDYKFAKHFGLPIPEIFKDKDISEGAFVEKEGFELQNSEVLNGLNYQEATDKIIKILEENGFGKGKVNYRLRDAVFSRQRYWGEPVPAYYKDGVPYMIEAEHLPLVLPEVDEYLPTETGEPPLGRAKNWAWDTSKNEITSIDKIDGQNVFPLELNTMPGWAGSSWYFLRYMDAKNEEEFASKEAMDYWQNVDLYMGGSEHATGHLLYARFWQKFMFDRGLVPTDEFAKKLINQGMILGMSAFVYRYDCSFKVKYKVLKEVLSINTQLNKPTLIDISQEKSIFSGYFISKNKISDINKVAINFEDITESEIILKFDEEIINNRIKNSIENIDFYEFEEIYDKKFFVTPIHVDVNLLKDGDELDIEKFKAWREEYADAEFICEEDGKFLTSREVEKMSKSKYNVVNPDDICEQYGADTLRLYEMFLGPIEQAKPWNTQGLSGVYSFLKKFWKLYHSGTEEVFFLSDDEPTKTEMKILHQTIKKVDEDVNNFSFNTSVSNFMIAVNELTKLNCNKRAVLEPLAVLISPYAPHITEEIWEKSGHNESISFAKFPEFDAKWLVEDAKEYPVSFNGKMRFKLELPMDLTKEQIHEIVMADERTKKQLEGRTPKNVIIVPGKIINIVG
jgi:leucyl-tRNA synthetase